MPESNIIGMRIAKLRKEKGLTQEQLANAVGITRVAITQYENGERIPKDEIKIALSKVLKQQVGSLFYNEK